VEGQVYFWGRSLCGETGMRGYQKYSKPTLSQPLSKFRIVKVFANKNASVCLDGTFG
jgi:hypothetical protein